MRLGSILRVIALTLHTGQRPLMFFFGRAVVFCAARIGLRRPLRGRRQMPGTAIMRLGVSVVAVAAALASGVPGVRAQPSPGWRIVATVGTITRAEVPDGFTATSATDAFSSWSCTDCSSATLDENFVERWNGGNWRPIALPRALNSTVPPSVISLSASSASNLWAVSSLGLVGIWNDRSWSVRRLPPWVLRHSRSGDPLAQAVVFSPRLAWIFCPSAVNEPTLAARYYHGAWHKVFLPAAPQWVSAVAPNDIWAVGYTAKPPWQVVMHWNGLAWRTLALPPVKAARDNTAYVGTATGPDSLWLTRQIVGSNHTVSVALLHWTGRWHVITVPFPKSGLGSIAQDGTGGLWLQATTGSYPKTVFYLYHYGHGRWTRRLAPAKPGLTTVVGALTWIPGTRSLWATGMLGAAGGSFGAILKYGP